MDRVIVVIAIVVITLLILTFRSVSNQWRMSHAIYGGLAATVSVWCFRLTIISSERDSLALFGACIYGLLTLVELIDWKNFTRPNPIMD